MVTFICIFYIFQNDLAVTFFASGTFTVGCKIGTVVCNPSPTINVVPINATNPNATIVITINEKSTSPIYLSQLIIF